MKAKSVEEIQLALEQSMARVFKPTLAIVFISIKQDRTEVCEMLNSKGIDILGATSSGEFIDEHHSEGEIAILLLELPRDAYSILKIKGSPILF